MKKTLLSLLALCAAFTMSADEAAVVKGFAMQPQPVYEISEQVQPNQKLARLAPKKATVTKENLVGSYVLMFDAYDYSNSTMSAVDPFYRGKGIELTAGEGDTLLMPNLFSSSGADIKLVFNADDQTLTIPQQVVYTSSSYGDCYFYEASSTKTPITLTIGDGSIYSKYYVNLSIASGDYAGYRLGYYYTLALYSPNGYIEAFSGYDKATSRWPVLVDQDESTNDIIVYNFANGEMADTMVYQGSAKWNIGFDPVIDFTTTYGDFYPYSAEVVEEEGSYNFTLNEDSTIVARGVTTQEIDWDGWALYSKSWNNTNAKNYYYDYFTNGKLVLVNEEFTDVKDITDGLNERDIVAKTYFNLAGVESATPFDGVNIVVTTFSDGTKKAVKVLK